MQISGESSLIFDSYDSLHSYDDIANIVNTIKSRVKLLDKPTIGIICGSGLGGIANCIKDKQIIAYSDIPGFPSVKVVGHEGNLIFGYISHKYVVCAQGRFHPYEHNMNLALCGLPVRVMHDLGVQTLIVSNAAGSINSNFQFGDLMLIKDHIFMPGLAGFSPLVSCNDPRFGARFVSMHNAYDPELRKLAKDVAKQLEMKLHEGIYVMSGGPQYESPAEARMLKIVGADALGMSTCHEVTIACQCRMRVLGFSLITNIQQLLQYDCVTIDVCSSAIQDNINVNNDQLIGFRANLDTDNSVEVTHEEVLETAKDSSQKTCNFVLNLINRL